MKKNKSLIAVLVNLTLILVISLISIINKPDKPKSLVDKIEVNKSLAKEEHKKVSSSIKQANNPPNKKPEVVIASASFFGNFDKVDDLMKDSDLVVRGTVIASEPYVMKNSEVGRPYTKLTFNIKRVISGEKN